MSADDTYITLKKRLQEDVKAALRAGDKDRVSVLRMALAAIQQREVDSRETLDESAVRSVLEKMVKQRYEAAEQFQKGKRTDLVDKENAEITVLKTYLPEPMSEEETISLVDEVITALSATSPQDMGRVMGEIKKRGNGRVDLGKISGRVHSRLQPS